MDAGGRRRREQAVEDARSRPDAVCHLHPCRRRPSLQTRSTTYIPVGESAQGVVRFPACFKMSDWRHSQVIGLWGGASLCRKEPLNIGKRQPDED